MKKAEIIVLAGQSNAVGCGLTEYLPHHFPTNKLEEYTNGYDAVQISYFSHTEKSHGFVKTVVGQKTFGPELGMAEYITQQHPDKTIYIVKCAFGGMALFRDWLSPSSGGNYDPDAYADQAEDIITTVFSGKPVRYGWCYNELVKLLKQSIADLEAQGLTPVIKGFCWMQGEADSEHLHLVEQYGTLYSNLVNDFTAEFGDYFDNCVFADGGISTIWPYYREINQAKIAYAEAHDNHRYADTIGAGLTTENEPHENPDMPHYDSDSVIKLGHLFAKTVLG